jgi:hypothetical protein
MFWRITRQSIVAIAPVSLCDWVSRGTETIAGASDRGERMAGVKGQKAFRESEAGLCRGSFLGCLGDPTRS